MLDLSVFFEQWKALMQLVLLLGVYFLLELFAVAQWVVHIMIDDTRKALVLPQVLLVMLHSEHNFGFYGKVAVIVRKCYKMMRVGWMVHLPL